MKIYPGSISRFFRVLFSVTVCSVVAIMIPLLAIQPWDQIERHYTHLAGGAFVALMFLGPWLLIFILIMTGLLFGYDRWRLKVGPTSKRTLIVLSAFCAVSFGLFFLNPFSHEWEPPSLWVGIFLLFIVLYWLMTGRVAGREGWRIKGFWSVAWDEKLYLAFSIWLLASLLSTSAPLLTYPYYANVEPRLGKPAFRTWRDVPLNPFQVAATHTFPDAQSCLERGADANDRADLARMDWDEIAIDAEAEVCMFRLLSLWGSVADAPAWLELQGFSVPRTVPIETFDGSLRVDGHWLIQLNGPRFPTTGFLRRILAGGAYSMAVNATFDESGNELLHVRVGRNVL